MSAMNSTRLRFATIALAGAVASTAASAQTKLLRFPDLHANRVVFTYAGDLWTAPATGGAATRLTAHPGLELFAKFSPDGRWIAFTGQYDGDEQVYLMPSDGGVPKRLTWYPARGPLPPRWGYDHQVYGWSPDGKSVLFRSMREGWTLTDTRLFLVPAAGGMPEPLPMPVSGGGDLSPDAAKVVYSPLTRDFRTWKRYEGGWAQDLYIFDVAARTQRKITDTPRTERDPMWIGDKVYFASDRTGTLNLYEFDPASNATRALTDSTVWDVRWPSKGDDARIVYESNGELQVYDIAAGKSTAIAIAVPTDGLTARPETIPVGGQISDFELSPKGERALFVARGDVFTAPIEYGPTRNLTRTSGAHEKWARWSPDGSKIAYISDESGEEELYVVPQDGSTKAERLTSGGAAMRYAPAWSPDGKRIAFSDKDGKLYVVTLEGRELREIADEARGQVFDYVWSPCGQHLAFSLSDPTEFRSLYIWSVGGETRRITGPDFQEYAPAWDPEGNYLFYLSDREFAPQISALEWNYAGNRQTGIFALALRKDVANPFGPRSDEVTVEPEKKKDDDAEADKKSKKKDKDKDEDKGEDEAKAVPKTTVIDWDGLAQRVSRVPVEADNYGALSAVPGHLVYVRGGAFYYGRTSDTKAAVRIFELKERKETTFAEDTDGFALSHDGKKILVRQGGAYKLYDLKPKAGDAKVVSTSALLYERDPAAEWRQIFHEVWRRYRDFFYVENMHGYDWQGLRGRYEPWLDHVGHRSDLNYLIGEMISELNVGHAYIAGGDFEIPERPPVALAGATFELDRTAGRYRIAEILRGQNEEDVYRSPLTEVGVDVREGDYLLAIDGVELTPERNPYELLHHKSDAVTWTVNSNPTFEGARKATYRPIRSEVDLRYLDQVLDNRARVDELSGGRVGYVHVPNMGAEGIREFIKWYYGQVRKDGLVVDVRENGGGNVSQMLIERLRRELLATRWSRTWETPGTYPEILFHGPMACILNENSASDGDIFPAMFREAGLGPLIGKRSWGGVIGITNRGTLIDGGVVNVPEFGFASADGRWVIEGRGVEPDIVVENDAADVLAGRDPQLERAVQEVLERLDRESKPLPPRPADPVR